jgi:hypothetical protein
LRAASVSSSMALRWSSGRASRPGVSVTWVCVWEGGWIWLDDAAFDGVSARGVRSEGARVGYLTGKGEEAGGAVWEDRE